ncbi:hypothetical protein WJX84_008836 [Apatococcus fuscideae]|uniref:Uncharacterized protein n=1 Tax=Apatococcus fuscideae TaxID=2026836 RepID=A0AAW1T5K3_9CHLO
MIHTVLYPVSPNQQPFYSSWRATAAWSHLSAKFGGEISSGSITLQLGDDYSRCLFPVIRMILQWTATHGVQIPFVSCPADHACAPETSQQQQAYLPSLLTGSFSLAQEVFKAQRVPATDRSLEASAPPLSSQTLAEPNAVDAVKAAQGTHEDSSPSLAGTRLDPVQPPAKLLPSLGDDAQQSMASSTGAAQSLHMEAGQESKDAPEEQQRERATAPVGSNHADAQVLLSSIDSPIYGVCVGNAFHSIQMEQGAAPNPIPPAAELPKASSSVKAQAGDSCWRSIPDSPQRWEGALDISPEYPDEEEPVRGDPSFQELKNMTSQELAELQDGYQLTREHVGGGRDARPGWVEETCRRILSMRREQATFEANTALWKAELDRRAVENGDFHRGLDNPVHRKRKSKGYRG